MFIIQKTIPVSAELEV